jgi:Flp pilus assembly protein TadD
VFDLKDADFLTIEARRANRSGDAPAAARLAKKALALYPDYRGALELLGVMYLEAKQFADAAHYFGILLKAIKD